MNKVSETTRIEFAVQLMLWALRRRGGEIPFIGRPTWAKAARLLRLEAGSGVSWRAHKDMRPYLEAAGFDESGTIVDYERFYAYLEAHAKGRKANTGRRATASRSPTEGQGSF